MNNLPRIPTPIDFRAWRYAIAEKVKKRLDDEGVGFKQFRDRLLLTEFNAQFLLSTEWDVDTSLRIAKMFGIDVTVTIGAKTHFEREILIEESRQ